ncbi:maleylacetate reductase [Acuticoccus sp.]|uniref:maleylacetate reductase n=1 Tax=Acuticoccus sp. TaxID=1904378 RepID=UPI003B518979
MQLRAPALGPPPFVHETLPQRIVYGPGRFADVGDEVRGLGFARPLIVATPGRRGAAERVREAAGGTVFAEAKMHAPAEVVEAAGRVMDEAGADGLVSCGGGSALGIAKALAHLRQVPILAVATTYSGSEGTARWSIMKDGNKAGAVDPIVLPRTVIYDPELTVSLPREVSAPSGMNAMAHAVACLYEASSSPIHRLLAADALARMARALPAIEADPSDLAARGDALIASFLCGTVMPATLGVHHKCAHVLGGAYALPHAEVHTVLLPHTAAYNAQAAPDAARIIAAALGGEAPGPALHALLSSISAPTSLTALGLARDAVPRAAEVVCAAELSGPRPADESSVRAMLERAWAGEPPTA